MAITYLSRVRGELGETGENPHFQRNNAGNPTPIPGLRDPPKGDLGEVFILKTPGVISFTLKEPPLEVHHPQNPIESPFTVKVPRPCPSHRDRTTAATLPATPPRPPQGPVCPMAAVAPSRSRRKAWEGPAGGRKGALWMAIDRNR